MGCYKKIHKVSIFARSFLCLGRPKHKKDLAKMDYNVTKRYSLQQKSLERFWPKYHNLCK